MFRSFLWLFAALLSFFSIGAYAAISASPNPSTTGNVTISWPSGKGEVWVSESINGGSASNIYQGTAAQYSVSGRPSGSYTYEALDMDGECYPMMGCFPKTLGTVTVSVSIPSAPSKPGNISAPSTASTGSYSTSWSASSGTVTRYQLQERLNGGSWSTVQNTTSRSKSFSKSANRYYDYRVRACNGNTCSAYTSTKRVTIPAGSVTASTNPTSLNYTIDAFTLSWSSVMTSSCSWSGGSLSATSGSLGTALASGWSYQSHANLWVNSFSVSCSVIGGGTVNRVVQIAALSEPPKPTVNVSWNKSSMLAGESATFSWSTSDTSACTLDGSNTGSSGSRAYSRNTSGSITKTIRCTNAQGATSKSASVTVNLPPKPTVNVSWNTSSVTVTQSATLSWNSSGATSCSLDGGSVSGSGSRAYTLNSAGTVNKTVTCSNLGGSTGRSASITVNLPPKPTVSGSWNKSSALVGESAIFSWSSSGADSCSVNGSSVSRNGSQSQTFSTDGTASKTITCTNLGGSTSRSASVVVTHPAPTLNTWMTSSNGSLPWDFSDSPFTLHWDSSNTSSCSYADGNGGSLSVSGRPANGQVVLNGSQLVWTQSGDYTGRVVVTCNGLNGNLISSPLNLSAVYQAAPQAPSVTASWSLPSVVTSQEVDFTWSSQYADSCELHGVAVSVVGSRTASFASEGSLSWEVVCTNANGITTRSVPIQVVSPVIEFPVAEDPVDDLEAGEDFMGYLGGNFQVGASGNASYSIPIDVAPGIRGMQPNLSLNYSSGSRNGLVGWGWGLGGLSRIHRCPADLVRDEYISGTQDGDLFKFCLDGQRLIEVSPGEYRTEQESGRKIVANGSDFTVRLRNGNVLEYGHTADARRTNTDGSEYVDWHLNKVTDIANNYMTYTYENDQDNGIHRITNIEYTKNSMAAGINQSVTFSYAAREDIIAGFRSGIYSQIDKRLSGINVLANGQLVRSYKLTYQENDGVNYADPANTSRLDEIKVCYDEQATQCGEPIAIEWASRAANAFGFTAQNIVQSPGNTRYLLADYNGDGVQEILYEGEDNDTNIYLIEKGEELNFNASDRVLTPANEDWLLFNAADLNNDGRADLIFLDNNGSASVDEDHSKLRVSYATDAGFEQPVVVLEGQDFYTYTYQFRDINGDGLLDIFRNPNPFFKDQGFLAQRILAGLQRIDISLNQGDGTFSEFSSWGNRGGTGNYRGTTQFAEMNGDGLIDMVHCKYIDALYEPEKQENKPSCNHLRVSINNGNSYNDPVEWSGASSPFFLSDMNGDGLADLINGGTSSGVLVRINNGQSFEGGQVWLNRDVTPDSWTVTPFSLVDVNADGRPDLVYRPEGGLGAPPSDVHVAYNHGAIAGGGFSDPVSLGISTNDFGGLDVDDNGIQDLSLLGSGSGLLGGNWKRGNIVHKNTVAPQLVTGIRVNDEHGITIGYSTLNDADVHTRSNTTAGGLNPAVVSERSVGQSQVTDLNGMVITYASSVTSTAHIVKNVSSSDGIGGFIRDDYHYSGFLRHLGGWGSLGFAEVESTRTSSNGQQTRTVSEYTQEVGGNYKVVGRPKTRTQYADDANGNLQQISRTQNHWYVHTMADDIDGYTSPHYRIIGDASHGESHDLNGAFVANTSRYGLAYNAAAPTSCNTSDITDFVTVSTTAHSSVDAYGNTHQSVSLNCDGTATFTTASKTQYENQTTAGKWLLGLVTNTQITSTSPDESGTLQSLTREQSNTYYANSGLPHTQTREPNNSDLTLSTTLNSYDDYGTPTSITESWNNTGGLNWEVDDAPDGSRRNSTMSVTYQSDGTRTITATNAAGHSTTSIVDGKFGQVRSFTDANSLTTTTTFDALGRIDTITAPDGSTVVNRYRVCDNCEAPSANARSYVHSKASGASAQRSYFDAYGRQVGQRMIGLTGIPSYTQIDYDAAGRVAKASEPFFIGGDRYDTEYTYDSLGRARLVTAPNDGETETQYNGLEITVTNAKSQKRTQWQNGIGQNIKTTDHYNTAIEYAYDPFGNLEQTEVIPAGDNSGVITTMGYDLLGRQTYLDDPSAGRIDYTYNGLDLMRTSTDAKNQRTDFSYDILGRQITRVDNAGASGAATRTHEWFYDTANSGEGRLDSVVGFDTDGVAYSEDYDYNAYGLPTIAETTIQGESYTTQTYYDDLNRPVGIAYPTGFTVVNHYNSYGYRHQVSNGLTEEPLWTANTADARGNITSSEHGNGVETIREYDADTGFVNSIHAIKDNPSPTSDLLVQNQDFTYDVLGNLTFREDQRVQMVQAFCYDKLNRLTAARRDQCSNSDNDITYDDLGNIQTRVMESGTQSYVYDATNPYKLMSTNMAGSYGYDDNGNITSGDGRTIVYSPFDKPTQMTKDGNTVDITYGSDQTRIKRVDSGNGRNITTYYVAGIYEKREEGGKITHLHQIGDIALHIWEEENGSVEIDTKYLHHDHIGSLVAKSNQAGDSVEFSASDPWGLRQDESWLGSILGTDYVPTDTREGFTGHEHMDGVGLIHMNGRVYDPNVGRFLSADPLIQAPNNTQSFNRYAYVWNNPLTMTDPSGYEGCGGQSGNVPGCKYMGVPAGGEGGAQNLVWQNIDGQAHYRGEDGSWHHHESLGGGEFTSGTLTNGMEFVSLVASSGSMGSVAFDTPSFGGGPIGNVGAPAGERTGSGTGYTYTVDHWVGADGEGRTLTTAHKDANSARMRAHFDTALQLYASFMLDPSVRSARELSALTPTSYGARIGAANLSAQEMQEGVAWITGGSLAAVGAVYATGVVATEYVVAKISLVTRAGLKQALKRAVGREYPTKTGYMGRPQPYNPNKGGRYLPFEANPGLVGSPVGRFSSGMSQGFVEGYAGVQGATPVGRAGNVGHAIGNVLGAAASLF